MLPAPPFVVAEAAAVAVVAVAFTFVADALTSDPGGGCREEGHWICVGISPTQPWKRGKRTVYRGAASGSTMGHVSCCPVGSAPLESASYSLGRVCSA
ncbi:hypothetical protein GUJ93_ZPchr0011g28932 [Zizania palustris]|uniref:Uncharacterized protein n=1 Tax=Zizania palustris TaxID=103762 RepID=A0A8J5WF45_ZIZPA|nr:hypothetical protein GUJ93_ZPchr0011g28932 [Zizania palustris]